MGAARCHAPPPANPAAYCHRGHGTCSSALNSTPPALLLFLHIEKTGGTTLSYWADRLVAPPHRLTSSYRYGRPNCLLALFPERWPGVTWRPGCGPRPDWRLSRLSFEFHAWSARVFHARVRPALPWLRTQYAAHEGRVVAATLIREPVAHLLSVYRMWPAKKTDRTRRVIPLSDVLDGSRRLQLRALARRPWLPRGAWAARSERACEVDLADARALLDDLDVVGVTECMEAFLHELLARLRLPVSADRDHHQLCAAHAHLPGPGQTLGGRAYAAAHAHGTWRTLDNRSRAAIVASVACDARLHEGVASSWGLRDGGCARRDGRELERLCGRPQIFWRGAQRRNLTAAGWSTSLRQC